MAPVDGLFDKPEPAQRHLSSMYAVVAYRSSVDQRARYANVKAKALPQCDECFANQHETNGGSGPRALAKVRRSFIGGPSLNLCRAHAALWKARDEEDTPPQ